MPTLSASSSSSLATHNQRGRGTLYLGTDLRLDGDLVELVESSMSCLSATQPVVEHAHLSPRFVEDSVL